MTPTTPLPRRRPEPPTEPVPAQAGSPLPPHVAVRYAVLRLALGHRAADDYARRALNDDRPRVPRRDPC